MRRIGICGVVAAVLAAVSVRATAACRTSASGAYSFDTRLSPKDRLCRMTVDVFEGRTCASPPRWQALLPCDQTEHMAISDRGRLISILAPVAKRRDLNVIRVTWAADKWAWAKLDKLSGGTPFKGPVRLSLQGDALKLTADRTVVIPFEALRHLVSSVGD